MRLLEHVALSESIVASGVASGQVDIQSLSTVFDAFHRPKEPLAATRPHLPALCWALAELPPDLGPRDTVWVVDDDLLDAAPETFVRIGPTEWVRSGGFSELRRVALALGALSATSRQLRHVLTGEETAREVAVRAGFSAADLRASEEAVPGLTARLVTLAAEPFLPLLRTRGVHSGADTARARHLWRALLNHLGAVDADHRPLCVWLAPLWVTDLVSPYTREVQPLLARWAQKSRGLERLAGLMAQGDADATYLCADLFSASDAEVDAERSEADRSAGIETLFDGAGRRFARICDTSGLDAALFDTRIGAVAGVRDAPIVIVLRQDDPDIGYALARLLCEVSANFRAVAVTALGYAAPGLDATVARAHMMRAVEGTTPLVAPTSEGRWVRPLALPAFAYLDLFGVRSDGTEPWYGSDHDALVVRDSVGQEALAQASWRGDMDRAIMTQRLWLDPDDDARVLETKRALCTDAAAHWRTFFGTTPAPASAEKKRLPPGRTIRA